MSKKKQRIIGLSFVSPSALFLLLRNHFDVNVFPSENWSAWLAKERKVPPVTVVEDRTKFHEALEKCGTARIIVLAQPDWLKKRNVTRLDSEEKEDTFVVKNLTVNDVVSSLEVVGPYKKSSTDRWRSNGDCSKLCAGCKSLLDTCKDKRPTNTRCETWERDTSKRAYRTYNLNHLIYLALKGTNEDALLLEPKEFWIATYHFASGRLPKNKWVSRYARLLITAETPKTRLKQIAQWIKRYGVLVAHREVKNPPSKLDLELVEKFGGKKIHKDSVAEG